MDINSVNPLYITCALYLTDVAHVTGELLVTGAHGKGISVCDMLILNQRKETISACLEFFKEVMGRDRTETLVIDKDFTEISVLQDLYPKSKVTHTVLNLSFL